MSGIRFRRRWISAREGINGRELASGAKAPEFCAGFAARLKPCPFKTEALSAYLYPYKTEAEHTFVPFQNEA
jgi:hypothetical protein